MLIYNRQYLFIYIKQYYVSSNSCEFTSDHLQNIAAVSDLVDHVCFKTIPIKRAFSKKDSQQLVAHVAQIIHNITEIQ